MIWARIFYQTINRPFKVTEGVRLNSANCDFLNKIFFAWYKFGAQSFKVRCVFILENASSHAFKLICKFFEHKRFTEKKIMEWTPGLNLIKNLWSF